MSKTKPNPKESPEKIRNIISLGFESASPESSGSKRANKTMFRMFLFLSWAKTNTLEQVKTHSKQIQKQTYPLKIRTLTGTMRQPAKPGKDTILNLQGVPLNTDNRNRYLQVLLCF